MTMVRSRWPRVLERLAHQLDEAQAADRRVHEAKATASRQGPSSTDLELAEYQRLRRAYVQTPGYKAASCEIEVAVVLMKVHDAALLRSARMLLARRADGKQPPRRLPKPRRLPGGRVPDWWMSSINTSYASIWQAIPAPGPELRLGGPGDPLVQEVAKQARLLQASRAGYRGRDRLYEAYQPDGGEPVEPIRGLSPELGRRANLALGRGTGIRIQPSRMEEADQLHTDYFAVWDRSRAYTAAVLALLRATCNPCSIKVTASRDGFTRRPGAGATGVAPWTQTWSVTPPVVADHACLHGRRRRLRRRGLIEDLPQIGIHPQPHAGPACIARSATHPPDTTAAATARD
ncbi:hypothetical protein ACH4PR_45850 [Streptomyces mirabilis]|uniref:hypothetical protein n=1 Tax=Streptomyces mirabilis TaxID=68239 RepID=UPI0037AFD31D